MVNYQTVIEWLRENRNYIGRHLLKLRWLRHPDELSWTYEPVNRIWKTY